MDEKAFSAQVILRDPEAAPAALDFFRSAGFETGALVGISFAISGAPERFEELFGVEGARMVAGEAPAELPLRALPAGMVRDIEAVAVAGPPDFGRGAG